MTEGATGRDKDGNCWILFFFNILLFSFGENVCCISIIVVFFK